MLWIEVPLLIVFALVSRVLALAGPPAVVRDSLVAAARAKVAQRTASAGGDGVPLGGIRAFGDITDPCIGDIGRRRAADTSTEDQPRSWAKSNVALLPQAPEKMEA